MAIPTPNTKEVSDFLASIADPARKADCERLVKIIEEVTGEAPTLWGRIIGFGARHYKYDSGHEGDTMLIGIAARKQALTLYGVIHYDSGRGLLEKLGPHRTGKGCLYIKHLDDINLDILKEMLLNAYQAKGAYMLAER